jgi:UDP-N-acetylglucosamine 2-epimerase (non-hydrolysing)
MKIVNVVGARPNFVKVAPLIRAMSDRPTLTPVLVHTGQHYDGPMSEQFFTELDIQPPAFNLGVGSGSHAVQTAEVMRRLEPILDTTRPDLVLVVGDVNSTLAAALTAVKLRIPVAHVEAGLRSFDRTMPEEINRLVTDAVADLLFVTEESGRENLLREGVAPEKIHFVGNVMIDALQALRSRWERSPIVATLGLNGEPYVVLTLHRPSNVDDPRTLTNYLEALQELARHVPIVFPVHPRVKHQLLRHQAMPDSGEPLGRKGIAYLDPLGYLDFIALISRARLVLTDSGGVQEETTVLGVPCLTLRNTTERPVTVKQGTNRVIGADPTRLVREALWSMDHPPVRNGLPLLWDGRAATRIVPILVDTFAARAGQVG